MIKASELKKGMVVDLDGEPFMVKQVEAKSPSARGAATLYKVRFNNLKTGQKRDESLKGDEVLKPADCVRMEVQYSYRDADGLTFMNLSDYSQYTLSEDLLEGQLEYLVEGMEGIMALIVDGQIAGIELPSSVALAIVETAPGIKGASATGRTKPATLTTGLEVQVPEYLEAGEVIKVNTSNGKFISRA